MAGDFNTTPNPAIDRKEGLKTIDQSNRKLHSICKNLDLWDIWRYKNPPKIEYTCRGQSRIDLILCSKSITDMTNVDIKHPYVSSDHKTVYIGINVSKFPRGPGYWKMNCSILEDQCYIADIKNLVRQLKKTHRKKGFSNMLLWEICKNRIKEFTIKFCKKKHETEEREATNIEKELSSVESMLKSNWSKQLEIRKNNLVSSLEAHYLQKAKAAQIRSRVNWVEQGEKSTKFFLGLEKHHQKHNMITALKTSTKKLSDFESILQEMVRFYTDLYSSKDIEESLMDEYLEKTNMESVLNEKEIALCEGPLSIDECTETISKMKKNKSPGIDGLPVEFYQTFWNEIKHMVVNALNESYQNGEMSGSQRRAVITLIFKKGDPELLKNWRPISLLNTNYKIAAFGIANRLQTVLSKLISKDQTAYVRQRFIGTNIRLIEDIYEYTEANSLQGAILYCDFEKAFDTLEIPFVIKVLQKYKFGPELQQWVKLFYTNIDASIKCNNWLSSPLKIHRGIRQGCPASALLFILVVELMAINIRANKDIKGIKLPDRDKEAKISQVADDTTLFVHDIPSIINVLEEIMRFGSVAGMRLNVQKTVGVWLGRWKERNESVGNITWTTDLVKALGVYFGHDVKKRLKTNWEEKICHVEQVLMSWNRRNLTLLGRILIAKTFAISKLTFLSCVMQCDEFHIKAINKLLFNFIWKGKRDKIKRNTIIAEKSEGGLKMVDFRLKDKALKCMMLKRLLEPGKEKWKAIPMYYLDKYGGAGLLLSVHALPYECKEDSGNKVPLYYKQLISALHACKT